MKPEDVAFSVALILGGSLFFLLPWFRALGSKHKNATPIFVLCFFCIALVAGTLFDDWPTAVGLLAVLVWVVALVWSLLADQESRVYKRRGRRADDFDPIPSPPPPLPVATPATTPRTCPHCVSNVPVPYSLLGTVVACPYCRGAFSAVP